MSFNVNIIQRLEGIYTVMPEGRLDSESYHVLEEKITPLFVSSTKVLVLDLRRLDYISSAGIRVFIHAKKALKKINAEFIMANLKPQIKKVFEIINALPDIPIFKNIEEVDDYLDIIQNKEAQKQKE